MIFNLQKVEEGEGNSEIFEAFVVTQSTISTENSKPSPLIFTTYKKKLESGNGIIPAVVIKYFKKKTNIDYGWLSRKKIKNENCIAFTSTFVSNEDSKPQTWKLLLSEQIIRRNLELIQLDKRSTCKSFLIAQFEPKFVIKGCKLLSKKDLKGINIVKRWIGELVISRLWLTISLYSCLVKNFITNSFKDLNVTEKVSSFRLPISDTSLAHYAWHPAAEISDLKMWIRTLMGTGIESVDKFLLVRPLVEGFYLVFFHDTRNDGIRKLTQITFLDEWLSELSGYVHNDSNGSSEISISIPIISEGERFYCSGSNIPNWNKAVGEKIFIPLTCFPYDENILMRRCGPIRSLEDDDTIRAGWIRHYKKFAKEIKLNTFFYENFNKTLGNN